MYSRIDTSTFCGACLTLKLLGLRVFQQLLAHNQVSGRTTCYLRQIVDQHKWHSRCLTALSCSPVIADVLELC
jgi:hypothetical protein